MKTYVLTKERAEAELKLLDEYEQKHGGRNGSIGQYLEVEQLPDIPGRKTHKWSIKSKGEGGVVLGETHWYNSWRQYVFAPFSDTEYSAGCLADIERFLKEANEQARRARGEG